MGAHPHGLSEPLWKPYLQRQSLKSQGLRLQHGNFVEGRTWGEETTQFTHWAGLKEPRWDGEAPRKWQLQKPLSSLGLKRQMGKDTVVPRTQWDLYPEERPPNRVCAVWWRTQPTGAENTQPLSLPILWHSNSTSLWSISPESQQHSS